MSAIDWRLALDAGLALLLLALVGYVGVLGRRMRAARGELGQVQSALIELAKIVGQANRGAAAPRPSPEDDALRDDLAFLVERGASLADRLERDLRLGLVRQRRGESDGAGGGRVVSLSEMKLFKSLKTPR